MGYPYTLDNTKQQAQDIAKEMEKTLETTLNGQVNYNLEKIKANHKAWAEEFAKAESARREEEDNWRKLYDQIYRREKSWWQYVMFFVLNGVQLWALTQQYNQQKQIAQRTYDLANRQLRLAEGMYQYYVGQFQPHETEMDKQIDGYFANPYKPQYEVTSGRFALNARMQMIGKRREVLMCASEYCTGATASSLKDLAIQEANLVANAMNSGVKYEKVREWKLEQKWVQTRQAFVAAGRGVAQQGITGIDGAVKAFHSFGADPGAALSQLLGTIAHTVGGIIPTPNAPRGGQIKGSSQPMTFQSPVGHSLGTSTVQG